jgi:hypothetical protein
VEPDVQNLSFMHSTADNFEYTGISAVFGDEGCDVPTPTPTVVIPSPEPPPAAVATKFHILQPTPISGVIMPPSPVFTMPISVRDLPAIPGPLDLETSEYTVPLPDLGIEEASWVLSVGATITESVGGSPLWGIVRYMGYLTLSLGLLGAFIYF